MEDNHIDDPRARAFVAELRRFEQGRFDEDGDPTGLVELFADGATATRLDARGERGDVGAFWREYRGQFREVRTTFFDAVESGDQVALEWSSEATLTDGRLISYRGVTVLDLDGEKIARLRTYYDSAAFVAVPAGATAAGR